MRRFTFLIVVLFLLNTSVSNAQYSGIRNAFSFNIVGTDYYSPTVDSTLFVSGETNWISATKMSYHRNLVGDVINLQVPFTIGKVRVVDFGKLDRSGKLFLGADLLLQAQFFKKNNFFVPYISAGIGGAHIENEGFDLQIPLSVGFDLKVFPGIYLQYRPEYRYALNDNRDSWHHNVGLKFLLGSDTEEPKEPKVELPMDSDGDGIIDINDECPAVAGTQELKGCPDGDGDGVADKDDSCPEVAGIISFNGCPDTDSDGLADDLDECPNTAGPVANKGCPFADTDGDGVSDNEDECPDDAGSARLNGCPDGDGDGVADKNDECPESKGLAKFNGCPDTDNDGITDKQDKCPNKAGPSSNDGCPEVKVMEKEDVEILTFATENIQFNTGSAEIKVVSLAVLDKVADILKKYPGYNCSIGGHTDSVGDAGRNKTLSEKRAKSCYDYLVSRGITSSRLSHAGYGETQPIGDNNNKAGREKNRRVEFNVYPRK